MKYLSLILKHKFYVFVIGRRLKVGLWRRITHDLTKLLPSEFIHYNRKFCGKNDDPEGFTLGWLHHQNRNDHHWEYWIVRGRNGDNVLEIPEQAVREMVADWLSASIAYEGKFPSSLDSWDWFSKNWDKLVLHPNTRKLVLSILSKALESYH